MRLLRAWSRISPALALGVPPETDVPSVSGKSHSIRSGVTWPCIAASRPIATLVRRSLQILKNTGTLRSGEFKKGSSGKAYAASAAQGGQSCAAPGDLRTDRDGFARRD